VVASNSLAATDLTQGRGGVEWPPERMPRGRERTEMAGHSVLRSKQGWANQGSVHDTGDQTGAGRQDGNEPVDAQIMSLLKREYSGASPLAGR